MGHIMTFWIVVLRIVGALLFLAGVVGQALVTIVNAISMPTLSWGWVSITPILENLALAILCFAVAAALEALRRIDHRIERATSRRRPFNDGKKDLAPVAPTPANTAKYAMPRSPINPAHVRKVDQEYYTYRTPNSKKHALK